MVIILYFTSLDFFLCRMSTSTDLHYQTDAHSFSLLLCFLNFIHKISFTKNLQAWLWAVHIQKFNFPIYRCWNIKYISVIAMGFCIIYRNDIRTVYISLISPYRIHIDKLLWKTVLGAPHISVLDAQEKSWVMLVTLHFRKLYSW